MRWTRAMAASICVAAVTYMAGKLAIRDACLERGYDAVGGEYLFIPMAAWAAHRLVHVFFRILEERHAVRCGIWKKSTRQCQGALTDIHIVRHPVLEIKQNLQYGGKKSMGNVSLQEVLDRKDSYNLAIPFVETQQITPFLKMGISLLYVNTDENALEIFRSGSRGNGNDRQEPLYSLAKPFLNRLATEAGIQFNQGCVDVARVDENTWKASATGGIRLPDGNIRTSNDFKVIDLATEERKYRMDYEEKAENGIREYRAATEASKRYRGQWVDTGQKNDKGYPVRLYLVAEQDRARYIENSLLNAMMQLRANAPQKAATGAKLRVIRALLGIKGSYTMGELKKPFAVARTSFSPDYDDPAVRQLLLQQAVQSIGSIFGNMQPVVQTISFPRLDEAADGMETIVESLSDGMQEETPDNWWEQGPPGVPEDAPDMGQEDRTTDFRCDKCNEVIPRKVWDYSMEHDGRPLCYRCQKIVRNEERGRRM